MDLASTYTVFFNADAPDVSDSTLQLCSNNMVICRYLLSYYFTNINSIDRHDILFSRMKIACRFIGTN